MLFFSVILTVVAAHAHHERRTDVVVLPATAPAGRNFTDAILHVRQRYGIEATLKEDLIGARTLVVPVTSIDYDWGYTVDFTIASQGDRKFSLLADTGSGEFWVYGTTAKGVGNAKASLFDVSKSKAIPGSTWEVGYSGGGKIGGNVYSDAVGIGGLRVPMTIQVAQHATAMTGLQTSGILGLSMNAKNWVKPAPTDGLVHNLQKFARTSGSFSIDFRHDEPGHQNDGGYIQFGGTFDKYGSLTWVDVLTPEGKNWDVTATAFKVGRGGSILHRPSVARRGLSVHDSQLVHDAVVANSLDRDYDLAESDRLGRRKTRSVEEEEDDDDDNANRAALDTGTTLILIEDATLMTIMTQIPGARYNHASSLWELPCHPRTPDLDAVWFLLGGRHWAPVPYVIGALLWYETGSDGFCTSTVQSRGSYTCDILGAAFFKGVYTVFDEATVRVGFTNKPFK